MTKDRRWLGREGEARAARFLESRGYRIVARNVRADRVEIDLIARRGTLLAFVEVKSRRVGRELRSTTRGSASRDEAQRHGFAAEAVDPRKQARLRHGAHAWLAANPQLARRTQSRRFDVVTCLFEGTRVEAERGDAWHEGLEEGRNETTAPDPARWSIEHWEAAF